MIAFQINEASNDFHRKASKIMVASSELQAVFGYYLLKTAISTKTPEQGGAMRSTAQNASSDIIAWVCSGRIDLQSAIYWALSVYQEGFHPAQSVCLRATKATPYQPYHGDTSFHILSDLSFDILSGTSSHILSDLFFDIFFWHSFWHTRAFLVTYLLTLRIFTGRGVLVFCVLFVGFVCLFVCFVCCSCCGFGLLFFFQWKFCIQLAFQISTFQLLTDNVSYSLGNAGTRGSCMIDRCL